jgi:hypothetical protein
MTKTQYERAVRKNQLYEVRLRWWKLIGRRMGISAPVYPPMLPRKPKAQEAASDPADWTGYYTWPEMRDLVLPAFTRRGV